MLLMRTANTLTIGGISIHRRTRAATAHWEWHASNNVYYLTFGVANPRAHKWWATTVWIYLPSWVARTPLARMPSTGHRFWSRGR
jgi:hypothetical protein